MSTSAHELFLELCSSSRAFVQEDFQVAEEATKASLVALRGVIARLLKTSPILGRGNNSEQNVGTPPAFLRACREVFGGIVFDLAADKINHVHPKFYSPPDYDSLHPDTRWPMYRESWTRHSAGHDTFDKWLWLNPPYADCAPWLARCAQEMERGRSIMVLIPASVGARWWQQWVDPYAYVLPLVGRLKFVGHKASFPRDLALCLYSNVWNPQRAFLPGISFDDKGLAGRPTKKSRYLGPWDWAKVVKVFNLLDN